MIFYSTDYQRDRIFGTKNSIIWKKTHTNSFKEIIILILLFYSTQNSFIFKTSCEEAEWPWELYSLPTLFHGLHSNWLSMTVLVQNKHNVGRPRICRHTALFAWHLSLTLETGYHFFAEILSPQILVMRVGSALIMLLTISQTPLKRKKKKCKHISGQT